MGRRLRGKGSGESFDMAKHTLREAGLTLDTRVLDWRYDKEGPASSKIASLRGQAKQFSRSAMKEVSHGRTHESAVPPGFPGGGSTLSIPGRT
jgi:hypothetical protein